MMKWIKNNKILTTALLGYTILAFISLDTFSLAVMSSKYYFVEMLQILPAVFILTSLIQTWVPTTTIMKYFGDGSGIKGYLLSFFIGSLSAGPIYAAFPVCSTLLKKGANLKNIIVILSTWAVVKVPMLINEVKFMGARYMVIRWILTVLAIYLMANLFSLLVKKSDLVLKSEDSVIDHSVCILCNLCLRKYPDTFYTADGKIQISSDIAIEDSIKLSCPVGAIR